MTQPTPQQRMAQLITGYWMTQMVYVAAKLELADKLKAGPQTAEQLAQATGTHAKSLYRLLRALAGVGVFAEDAQHRFGLTPLGETLRKDVPGSQWAMAAMTGEEHYQAWGELLYSIRTGEKAFEKLYQTPCFDYLSQHEEKAKVFDLAMVSIHGRETGAMLEAYDFSGITTLADVGGGNGSLITAVLQKYPKLKGMLYDLPGVIARAKSNLAAAGLAERCQAIPGNFFETVPPGADAYLMRHIIHDWNDAQCTQILRNIHRVLPAHGKVLVVESVIRPGNDFDFAKMLDLTMLLIPGGQERTEEEFRTLFTGAGFKLNRIVPTPSDMCVLEAVKA
jgi:ubiquinone/menaquinone biosynthesis C-methylase UbiE